MLEGHWKPLTLHKKWSFPLRTFSVNVTKSAITADLGTFTEEIRNGKLHFLCSVSEFPIRDRAPSGLRTVIFSILL